MRQVVHNNGKGVTVAGPPRKLGDHDVSLANARSRLGDLVSQVSYRHDRIVITKHGRPVAAIVPAHDLELLEELEDRSDIEAAKASRAGARKRGTVPLRKVLRDLGLR